jgi:hypothetical protein
MPEPQPSTCSIWTARILIHTADPATIGYKPDDNGKIVTITTMISTIIEERTRRRTANCSDVDQTSTQAGHRNAWRHDKRYRRSFAAKVKTMRNKRTEQRNRFQRAFDKALLVRERNKGSPLTVNEKNRLAHAVRKQCDPRQRSAPPADKDTLRHLCAKTRLIEAQLNHILSLSLSQRRNDVKNSFELAHLQLQMLRNQMLSLLQENSSARETCSHVLYQTRFPVHSIKHKKNFEDFISFSILAKGKKETRHVGVSKEGRYSLCCDQCLSARSDYFFEITGEQPVFTFDSNADYFQPNSFVMNVDNIECDSEVLRKLRASHPLAHQHVWQTFLDLV